MRGANRCKSEKNDRCKKKRDKEVNEQRENDASLYLKKATNGAMQGALLETSAPNLMGRRFA